MIRYNLELAFPDKTDDERDAIARGVARHFARSTLDAIRIQRLTPDELMSTVTVHGWSNVESALERGRGIFFLTAHIGSWEVAALATGLLLPDPGLAVINRPLDNPHLEQVLARLRTLYGNHVFGKRNILREMIDHLRANGGIGILIDQRVLEQEGILVPFFGHPAWTHPILARISRKTRAAVVPTVAMREGPGRYGLHYDPAVYVDELPEEEREDVPLTAHYLAILEQAIRRQPDQWLWYHDRWKQLRLQSST